MDSFTNNLRPKMTYTYGKLYLLRFLLVLPRPRVRWCSTLHARAPVLDGSVDLLHLHVPRTLAVGPGRGRLVHHRTCRRRRGDNNLAPWHARPEPSKRAPDSNGCVAQHGQPEHPDDAQPGTGGQKVDSWPPLCKKFKGILSQLFLMSINTLQSL